MSRATSPDHAAHLQRLFDAVVDLGPASRTAFLDQHCRDDALRREVEALLDAYDNNASDVRHALEQLPGTPRQNDAAPSPAWTGRTVSHYRVHEKLGGGGMGVVYKATDTRLDRTVALKVLPPDLTRDEDAQARFIHEAKAASALDHANIGYIHEIDQTEEGQLFIAMAYYAGETLKAKVARGPLPLKEALGYAEQMAQGLARAHERGIVHRDVKPANVMVTDDGVVKLVDFGLAKVAGQTQLTLEGTTLGTVSYMSPEQARGETVDQRTDLWSLGVVLYEMLTGRRPFRGEYGQAILYSVLHEEPLPVGSLRAEVPEALERVVEKALAKDPAARYQQADEMLADLNALRQGDEPSLPVASPSPFRRRYVIYGGAALLVVLLLFLVGRMLMTDRSAPIRSIGVLPMTNLSGNPDREYVADGMTDLLISTLSRLSGLDRVISRTSMMQYKHTDKTLVEIGRELGVDALIEASVRSDGERMVVTVNLIEAATERNLWGQTYERAFRDVLKLQQEMTLAIAGEVEVALTPQEEAHLGEAPAVEPRAMDRYLLGQNAWHKDELMQTRDYFEEAIAIDSSFAQPYAGLPVVYLLLDGATSKAKAMEYAKKALELDPMLSEARVAMGIIQTYDWAWAASEASFRKAIELNPNNSEAHRELGLLLSRTARFDEAVASLRRAVQLAPLSSVTRGSLRGYGYYDGRQFDQLIEDARLDSNYYWIGQGYLRKGQFAQAKEAFATCCEGDTLLFAYFYAVSGERDEALSLLQEIEGAVVERLEEEWKEGDIYHERFGLAFGIAVTYAALREADQAFAWLDRAREALSWGLGMVLTDPALDPLRTEPRFHALAEEIGMDPWGRLLK